MSRLADLQNNLKMDPWNLAVVGLGHIQSRQTPADDGMARSARFREGRLHDVSFTTGRQ